MPKPILFLVSVTVFVFAVLPGAVKIPAQAGKAEPKVVADPLAGAKKLYARDCLMCHGDNGNGQTDMATSMKLKMLDWSDPKSLADKSDQALIEMIRKGKDMMPPEDSGRAKDDEVKGLVQYIRTFAKAQPAAAAQAGPTN